MSSSLLLPVTMLFAGTVVVLCILWFFWRGVAEIVPSISLKDFLARRRVKRLEDELIKIDEAIRIKNISLAERIILKSFIAHPPFDLPPDIISRHNMAVLSKSVTLLEAFDAQSRNLHIIEKALYEQSAFLKQLNDSSSAKRKVQKSIASEESKQWALKELDEKIGVLNRELKINGARQQKQENHFSSGW